MSLEGGREGRGGEGRGGERRGRGGEGREGRGGESPSHFGDIFMLRDIRLHHLTIAGT